MENLEFFEALGMTPMEDKLTPEQIGKVKGLGCLKDKRYDDIFNIRVVTRNGRITTDESRAIAEAADRFGSGEIAMTSRMGIEVQGVEQIGKALLDGFGTDRRDQPAGGASCDRSG